MDSGCYKVRAETFGMNSLDSLQHTRYHVLQPFLAEATEKTADFLFTAIMKYKFYKCKTGEAAFQSTFLNILFSRVCQLSPVPAWLQLLEKAI